MNRIILIGNGFDKAHGLPTGYTDFMDSYWTEFSKKVRGREMFSYYEDEFVKVPRNYGYPDRIDSYSDLEECRIQNGKNSLLRQEEHEFKNQFFGHISGKKTLTLWLDIENEYYCLLKSYLNKGNNNELVKTLNGEFCEVKTLLEKYLTDIANNAKIEKLRSIRDAFSANVYKEEIAIAKKELLYDYIIGGSHPDCRWQVLARSRDVPKQVVYKEVEQSLGPLKPQKTLILNFNYTKTAEELYASSADQVINIHGELNNPDNPIIFGYGDELDEDYREIEKANDSDFLDNIKHIHYARTKNYRQLLEFLSEQPYQVCVMGLSCGNSDRTLLQTIFENPNCTSLKPFYHQWETGDNYMDIYKNISRNFNDKKALRDIVVNKEYCTPLVPCSKEIVAVE